MAHLPIPRSEILTAITRTGFGKKALRYRADPRFSSHEMAYKLILARAIRQANDARESGNEWATLLSKAVGADYNNIVNWRLKQQFGKWCKNQTREAAKAVHQLLATTRSIEGRIEQFEADLDDAGIHQPGAKLCLTSILLMSQDFKHCPPVRTGVLNETLKLLELDWPTSKATVVERYTMFMAILDALIEYSMQEGPLLSDRMEAQGAVWCVTSAWMDRNIVPTECADLGNRTPEEDLSAAVTELSGLESTEQLSLVAARRGQGRYRSDLITLWLGCSVTGCQNYQTLRASHLKPWRLSNNRERLDPFNGLLLTPNLDSLLDQYLISFDRIGNILISSCLSEQDCLSLGVNDALKITGLKHKHQPFLAFHRRTFDNLEKLRRGGQEAES